MHKAAPGVDEIYQAVQFIEANLCEQIIVDEMAQAAGYSIFHFSRLFNSLSGHSPYDYLIRRRLSEAARCLKSKEDSITHLAFKYQFGSLEAFSRSFKKMFGVSPVKCRESATGLPPGRMALTMEYLLHINRNAFFTPQMITLPDFFVTINIIDSSIPRPMALVYPNFTNSQVSLPRFFCDQVADQTLAQEDEAIKLIPKQNYAKFNHRTGKIALTYQYIWQTWLPLAGYSTCKPYILEQSRENSVEGKPNSTELLIPIQ